MAKPALHKLSNYNYQIFSNYGFRLPLMMRKCNNCRTHQITVFKSIKFKMYRETVSLFTVDC